MKIFFRLLTPYVAVGVFWLNSPYGWFALFAYHALALLLMNRSQVSFKLPSNKKLLLLALPAVLAGPATFFLLPHLTDTPIALWLNSHGISQQGLLILIPYFGLIHPWIEQAHWSDLRNHTPIAHLLFAGYHVLVLSTLLPPAWLIAVFIFLSVTSMIWKALEFKSSSLFVPTLSHLLADFGIIGAAYLLIA